MPCEPLRYSINFNLIWDFYGNYCSVVGNFYQHMCTCIRHIYIFKEMLSLFIWLAVRFLQRHCSRSLYIYWTLLFVQDQGTQLLQRLSLEGKAFDQILRISQQYIEIHQQRVQTIEEHWTKYGYQKPGRWLVSSPKLMQ